MRWPYGRVLLADDGYNRVMALLSSGVPVHQPVVFHAIGQLTIGSDAVLGQYPVMSDQPSPVEITSLNRPTFVSAIP